MTTLGVNVGDEFIREGILSFVDAILPRYKIFYVNKHDLSSLSEHRLDEVERLSDKFRQADVIIQGGAPVYWKLPTGSASYNVDWAEELWFKRIFKLGAEKIILNVGAGSCLPYRDDGKGATSDPAFVDFAQKVDGSCRWVSVRDPIAGAILDSLGLKSEKIACPAFHASRRLNLMGRRWDNRIGVNLMPLSGHFSISPEITMESTEAAHQRIVEGLRQFHRLLFIAHNAQERSYLERFRKLDEVVFLSSNYRDYFEIYSGCSAVFANRVHGALCAAGFGVPALIVGNDSRLQIADFIGIPRFYAGDSHPDLILEEMERLIDRSVEESERLRALRDSTARQYIDALSPILADLN